MKNYLTKMNLEEINRTVGILLTPTDVFQVLDNKYHNEYIELLENGKISKTEDVIEYVMRRQKNVNKEKTLLITLKNALDIFRKIPLGSTKYLSYNIIIERLKENFEGKRFSIFRLNKNPITHIEEIEEIVAEELCAVNILGENLDEKEKKTQNRREEIYKAFKIRKESKKKNNLGKIKKLEEKVEFRRILDVIKPEDIADSFAVNSDLGELLVWIISKNTLLKEGFEEKQINKLDVEEELEKVILDEYHDTFLEELEKIIKEYADYIDIDKLLLTAACRLTLLLEDQILSPEYVEEIKKYMELVLDELENKKSKVEVIVDQKSEEETLAVRYSEKDVKNQLKRFIEPGVYLGEALLQKTKENLLKNEQKLSDINPVIVSVLSFGIDQIVILTQNSPENLKYIIDNTNINSEQLRNILDKLEKIETDVILELVERKILEQVDIIELYKKGKIEKRQLFDIAEKEIIDDQTIVRIYKAQKEETFDDEQILNENELLEFFNIEEIEQYIKNNEIEEEFLEFYKEILPKDEKTKIEILSKINEILTRYDNKDITEQFYIAGLLETKNLKGKISEYDVISMFENEKIDFEKLVECYRNELITDSEMDLLVNVYDLSEKILEKLDDDKITVEKISKLNLELKENYIYERYMKEENSFKTEKPAIIGIANSNINLKQLEQLYSLGKVKESDLYEYAKKGIFNQKAIRDLYIKSLISDEILEELCSKGIISEKSMEYARKNRNMKQLSQNIDEKLGMHISEDGIEIDDCIILPLEKIGNPVERTRNIPSDGPVLPMLKKVIEPAIRDKKIKSLGAVKIKRDCVQYEEKNPFNDYEFYIIPAATGEINPECIVLAERYYEDKFSDKKKLIDSNATYLFKLSDLTRISKKSKPEIISLMKEQKEKNMKRVSHTKHWAKNLDEAIASMYGKKMKSIYTKEELKQIDTINELIDGFEDPTNGEYSRPFDVYYY